MKTSLDARIALCQWLAVAALGTLAACFVAADPSRAGAPVASLIDEEAP